MGRGIVLKSRSFVTLVEKEKRFHAHKMILATRSEYFKAMLYGVQKKSDRLKESVHVEIIPKETDPIAF